MERQKFHGKTIFVEVQLTGFENKRTFMKKGCTAYNHSQELQNYT